MSLPKFLNLSSIPDSLKKPVEDFVFRIENIKPGSVQGFYILGSIAFNDFYFNNSDVDFLFLFKDMPDKQTIAEYEKIHQAIRQAYKVPDFNGFYIDFGCLINIQTSIEAKVTHFYRGEMLLNSPLYLPKYNLFDLATIGLSVYGTNAKSLPIKITVDEVIDEIYKSTQTYWYKWINKYSKPLRGLLAIGFFPALAEYSITTMSRNIYLINEKKITSKSDAVKCCLNKLPDEYHSILSEVLNFRKSNRSKKTIRFSFTRRKKTMKCLIYMMSEFDKHYKLLRE